MRNPVLLSSSANQAGTTTNHLKTAIAALSVLLLLGASSGSRLPRGLVGWTTATVPNVLTGPLLLTKMCQQEFPASRICTVDEVGNTQVVPTLPEGEYALALIGFGTPPSSTCGLSLLAVMDSTGLMSTCTSSPGKHVACCAGQPELLGDIDGNGKLDLADDTLLRRYLAGELSALPG